MAEHNAEPAASERDLIDASAAIEPVTVEMLQAQLEEARSEAGLVDLAYAHQKVGVEYDGASHLTRDRIRADRARHNWLEERGWAMRYFTDRDIYRTPDRVVEIVARALNRRSSPIKERLT